MTPVTFAVGGSLAFGGSHELSWAEYTLGAFLLTGPYAYIVTLFLGVPGYYFLRSKGWLKAGILSLAGALLGLLGIRACIGTLLLAYRLLATEQITIAGTHRAALLLTVSPIP
jgi:hypothetical protein